MLFWAVVAGASPRSEVVHQVSNQHYDALTGESKINGTVVSKGDGDGSLGMAIRIKDMKLIVGDPGDHRFVTFPPPGATSHAFGSSGGGENRAPSLPPSTPQLDVIVP